MPLVGPTCSVPPLMTLSVPPSTVTPWAKPLTVSVPPSMVSAPVDAKAEVEIAANGHVAAVPAPVSVAAVVEFDGAGASE